MSAESLKHALSLAACGLRVVPIEPGKKHPRMASWQHAATTDPRVLKNWYNGLYRGHGVGIALGRQPDGRMVFALDVDTHDADGFATLAELQEEWGGWLPTTPTSQTGGGGMHVLLTAPFEVTNGKLGPGIDIRGQGGQIVVAPTIHPSGQPYVWAESPWDHEIAEAPDWILELLRSTKPDVPSAPERAEIRNDFDGGTPADELRADWSWPTELKARGWTHLGGEQWARPGKDPHEGASATLKGNGAGPLNVFSTDESMAPLWAAGVRSHDGTCVSMSPFAFKAAYEYGGNLSAAARGLRPQDDLDFQATPSAASQVSIEDQPDRRIVLTPASAFKVRRVRWVWDERLALGTLGLLAGPEGLGKSTIAYWLAACITKGILPGEYWDQPRSVLVCATEDSWEHTIVPRLMAHGADLDRVYRLEVRLEDDIMVGLSLPNDLAETERAAREVGAALLILDPLMSRLNSALDTHRDGEVRRALEPLVSVADNTGMAILGLIHHNKSGSDDPLQLVMASKAFTAVARSVHTTLRDPDDESGNRRLFGTPKNNLGRIDLPTMSYTISGWEFDTDDGPGTTGQIQWGDDVDYTIADALRRSEGSVEQRGQLTEAAEWLKGYMEQFGPRVRSRQVHDAARTADIAKATLDRARRRLGIVAEREKTARPETWWVLPTDETFEAGRDPPADEISIF